MQYQPLNDYVIVKKGDADRVTSSGIILTSAQGADKCTVVAVADNVKGVAAGDSLLIRWSNALKIDGDVYAVDAKEIVTKFIS